MRYVIAILILFSLGCAKKSDTPNESGLFQTWTNSAKPTLSLAGGHFGTNNVSIVSNDTICKCEIMVTGYEDMGDLEIKTCSLSDGLTASSTCTALEETYEYEFDGSTLELCVTGTTTCHTYN